MTAAKRVFDLVLALGLGLLVLPLLLVLLLVVWLCDGWPPLHVSERIGQGCRPFRLYKLRTMRPAPEGIEQGVSGGDKADRITRIGRFLRKYRLDELPQLWNIVKGDMSFVGPRPPLGQYARDFPELYGEVLKSRPGITGLATLVFHRREEELLARCRTPEETEHVYMTRCIPRKARLDLIYSRKASVCLDLWIIWKTLAALFLPGRRRQSRARDR